MKKTKSLKALAAALSITTAMSMIPSVAFANDDEPTIMYGQNYTTGSDLIDDYTISVAVKIDKDKKILEVKDDGSSKIIQDSNKPYWDKYLKGKGFDLFKGKSIDTLQDIDSNAVSGATVTMSSVKKAVKNAYENEYGSREMEHEGKEGLRKEIAKYGKPSDYIESDEKKAEELISNVLEKIKSARRMGGFNGAMGHYRNFVEAMKHLKKKTDIENDNAKVEEGKKVKNLIDKLGEIKVEKKADVETARRMYNMLDAKGRKAVDNYSKLKAAEAKIFDLLHKSKAKKLIGKAQIENYGYDVVFSIFVDEEGKIVKIEDAGTDRNVRIQGKDDWKPKNIMCWQDFVDNNGIERYLGRTKKDYKEVDNVSSPTCIFTNQAATSAVGSALEEFALQSELTTEDKEKISGMISNLEKLSKKLDKSSKELLDKLEKEYNESSEIVKTEVNKKDFYNKLKKLRKEYDNLMGNASLNFTNITDTKAINKNSNITLEDNIIVYTKNISKELLFRTYDAEREDFLSIEVDEEELKKESYELEDDALFITLNKKFVDSLNDGIHTLRLNTRKGFAEIKFKVASEEDEGLEVKKYTRKAKLVKTSGDTILVFSDAFNPIVRIDEKGNKATYTVGFKEAGMMGITEKQEKITVDGVDLKPKTGKTPYVTEFEIKRNKLNEDEIPVTVYSKTMGSSWDCKIVFTGDKMEAGSETPTPSPNPGTPDVPNPGNTDPQVNPQADKKFFHVEGKFLKPSGEEMRLMTEAFNPLVKLIEQDGKAIYEISFKEAGMMGKTEILSKIRVDGREINGHKGQSPYLGAFKIVRNKLGEQEIPLEIYIGAMKAWMPAKVVLGAKKEVPEFQINDKLPTVPDNNSNNNTTNPNPSASANKPALKAGAAQTWVKGSKQGLVFISDADFSTFKTVRLDGKELVRDVDYTAVSGSTKITLKPHILDKLTAGVHNLEIVSTTGSVMAKFTVAEPGGKTPKTGDNSNPMALAAIALLGGAGLALVLRKKLAK